MQNELERDRREPDGLLHASSHLIGSLRHAQLEVAGAPQAATPLMSQIRMMTGTLWHKWLADALRSLGLEVMCEVNVTPWLPSGWGGTADIVVHNPELGGFVLVDLKTTKGEGMRFVREGPKDEHRWQVSAYWHALKTSGLPMVKQSAVFYLPMNDIRGGGVEPLLTDFEPLPADEVFERMDYRADRTKRYVESVDPEGPDNPGKFLTWELEPEQELLQKLRLDRKTGDYELWLEPHWSSQFCSFPDELCSCSQQEKVKVGLFSASGEFFPRPGYEDLEPAVFPKGG